jgi:hypothetical protein
LVFLLFLICQKVVSLFFSQTCGSIHLNSHFKVNENHTKKRDDSVNGNSLTSLMMNFSFAFKTQGRIVSPFQTTQM